MKIKVMGFTKNAMQTLLTIGIDHRGSSSWTQNDVNRTKKAMEKIIFPCMMEVTEETDMNYKRILKDCAGYKWSETHFVTKS